MNEKLTVADILNIDSWAKGLQIHTPTRYLKRLEYALKRNAEVLWPEVKKMRERIEDIDLEHAATDTETKQLILSPQGGFTYTKEGEINRRIAVRNYLASPYYGPNNFYTIEYSEELKNVTNCELLFCTVITGAPSFTAMSEDEYLASQNV